VLKIPNLLEELFDGMGLETQEITNGVRNQFY
jgi:hypothetical protein